MKDCTQLLIHQVLHLYMQRSMYLLKDLKLHPGQCGMLLELSKHNGLSQKELAEKMHITPPSITVMVRKMEADGLLEKRLDEKDQRVSRIYITEKGRAITKQMDVAMYQMEEEAFSNMSDEERETMRALLIRMKDNLTKGGKH